MQSPEGSGGSMEFGLNQSHSLLRNRSSLDGLLDRVNGMHQDSNYRTGDTLSLCQTGVYYSTWV